MVESETVIPVVGCFYEAQRINPRQYIWGEKGKTFLEDVIYSEGIGILVETKYYSIIVSPNQLFLTPSKPVRAIDAIEGLVINTDDGESPITKITVLNNTCELYEIKTSDGTFKANGFYLVNE